MSTSSESVCISRRVEIDDSVDEEVEEDEDDGNLHLITGVDDGAGVWGRLQAGVLKLKGETVISVRDVNADNDDDDEAQIISLIS